MIKNLLLLSLIIFSFSCNEDDASIESIQLSKITYKKDNEFLGSIDIIYSNNRTVKEVLTENVSFQGYGPGIRTFSYNNGRIDRIDQFNHDRTPTGEYQTLFYGNDQLKERQYWNEDEFLTEKITYSHINGQLIEAKYYSYDPDPERYSGWIKTLSYKYDSNGNTTKLTQEHFNFNNWEELFSYDDKLSPFALPQIETILDFRMYPVVNNLINSKTFDINGALLGEENFEHEYNENDYTISRTYSDRSTIYEYN